MTQNHRYEEQQNGGDRILVTAMADVVARAQKERSQQRPATSWLLARSSPTSPAPQAARWAWPDESARMELSRISSEDHADDQRRAGYARRARIWKPNRPDTAAPSSFSSSQEHQLVEQNAQPEPQHQTDAASNISVSHAQITSAMCFLLHAQNVAAGRIPSCAVSSGSCWCRNRKITAKSGRDQLAQLQS